MAMAEKDRDQTSEIVKICWDYYQRDAAIYDKTFLEKSVARRMAALKMEMPEYTIFLKESPAEATTLINSLNITYSRFFRNPLTFALLEQLVLPQLLNRKTAGSEIRIWSAGCATGQEAYSLGILLEELVAVVPHHIRYRVFATDRSPEALLIAQEGSYDEESVADLKWGHLKKYFEKTGECFTIESRVKEKIDFSVFDLLDSGYVNPPGSIFGDFDMIVCCNLLFYYRMDVRQQIINKFKRSLSDKGFLITGEAESIFVGKDSDLKMIDSGSTIFQLNR
jgi:chemotaxis methyl-accepting protein methylase